MRMEVLIMMLVVVVLLLPCRYCASSPACAIPPSIADSAPYMLTAIVASHALE